MTPTSNNGTAGLKPPEARAEIDEESFIFGRDLFPSESRSELRKLTAELEIELNPPPGPLAKAIVQRIAVLLWRLRHLDIFHKAREAARKYKPFVEGRTLQEAKIVHDMLLFNMLVETVEGAQARKKSEADRSVAKEDMNIPTAVQRLIGKEEGTKYQ